MSDPDALGRGLPLGAVIPPGGAAAALAGLTKERDELAAAGHDAGANRKTDDRPSQGSNVIPFTGPQPPAERTCCACGAAVAPFGLGPPGGARRWPERRRATWWHCGGSGCESAALAAWRQHYNLGAGGDG
jgi:hypothetical protein